MTRWIRVPPIPLRLMVLTRLRCWDQTCPRVQFVQLSWRHLRRIWAFVVLVALPSHSSSRNLLCAAPVALPLLFVFAKTLRPPTCRSPPFLFYASPYRRSLANVSKTWSCVELTSRLPDPDHHGAPLTRELWWWGSISFIFIIIKTINKVILK